MEKNQIAKDLAKHFLLIISQNILNILNDSISFDETALVRDGR